MDTPLPQVALWSLLKNLHDELRSTPECDNLPLISPPALHWLESGMRVWCVWDGRLMLLRQHGHRNLWDVFGNCTFSMLQCLSKWQRPTRTWLWGTQAGGSPGAAKGGADADHRWAAGCDLRKAQDVAPAVCLGQPARLAMDGVLEFLNITRILLC